MTNRPTRALLLAAVLALVAAACSQSSDTTTTTGSAATTQAPATTTAASDTTAPPGTEAPPDTEAPAAEVSFDVGVTAEPCPEGNPDHGCIYLGILTDETGPFAGASPALVGGHKAFWATVNAEGGIGDQFDVAVTDDFKRDTGYVPEAHVAAYAEIANDVVALAESLGTSQTVAALPDYARDQTIGSPASWWSGWAFEDIDQGLVLEYGTNYCFEAMNGVDWSIQAVPAAGLPEVETIGVIFHPTDYGGDYAAGVAAAAEANGIETAWRLPIVPVAAGGDPNQVEAVAKVVSDPVDVVFMAVAPSETAPIVGGAAQQGTTSIFVGAAPSWNVALLDTAAAPAFEAGIYFQSAFVGPWATDTPGHNKMRATLESLGVDPQDFFVTGWVSQYPIKAALEAGVANGDITKPGVAQAAVELTEVDFEGMMPAGQYSGDVADRVPRETIMGGFSADSPTGIEIVQDFFVGPTAAAYDFSEPCFTG
jgi:hypothetical protein